MKSLKITIAALAMLVTLGVQAQTPQEVATKYNEAIEFIKAKDFGKAIPLLVETIEMAELAGPDSAQLLQNAKQNLPQLYFQYGGTFIQAQKPEEALPYFEKAIQTAEKYGNMSVAVRAKEWVGRTYFTMGANAFNEKDYATAVEIFEKGYKVDPTNMDLATNLAVSYGEMKEYEKGFNAFREIVALERHGDKYKDAVYNAKGKLSYYLLLNANDISLAEPAKAIKILEEAIVIDSENSQAHMLLIQTANNLKNFDKVIEFGAQAAEVQGDAVSKSNAYFLVGAAYDNKGNAPKAIESYRKVTVGANAAKAKSQIIAIQAAQ